jgi:hypothetical protein
MMMRMPPSSVVARFGSSPDNRMARRWNIVVGALTALAGVLVACNGLVSGPHAFEHGWSGVVGSVIAGCMFIFGGAWVLKST